MLGYTNGVREGETDFGNTSGSAWDTPYLVLWPPGWCSGRVCSAGVRCQMRGARSVRGSE